MLLNKSSYELTNKQKKIEIKKKNWKYVLRKKELYK